MKTLAITTLLLLVLAAPSFAGEAEDKFHAAYAQEVVEGDVKGAALVYLALMEDDSASAPRRDSASRSARSCSAARTRRGNT